MAVFNKKRMTNLVSIEIMTREGNYLTLVFYILYNFLNMDENKLETSMRLCYLLLKTWHWQMKEFNLFSMGKSANWVILQNVANIGEKQDMWSKLSVHQL